MAKNNLADLDTTATNNTDFRGQGTTGAALVSTIDTIFQQLASMLARFYDDIGATGTVGGTADAITLTTTSGFQSLATGLFTSFKAASANTGAATINVDGLGAKAIRRPGDSALSANDIVANGVYMLRYDTAYNSAAGAWVLLNQTVSSTISAASTTEALTGTDTSKYITADALAALWEKGSDIASAATISIGEGGYHHVTGTTAITDIDWATAKNGRGAWLIFDGALTLTYNATTLTMPGAADITTAAGDAAYVVQDATDNAKVLFYQRAASTAAALTLGTEQATTSGTTKDFTIPSGVKRIVVMLDGVSLSGVTEVGIQLGDAGGIEATGYTSYVGSITGTNSAAVTSSTTQFELGPNSSDAANTLTGAYTLTRMDTSNTWLLAGTGHIDAAGDVAMASGIKATSGELTTVRLMGGTFDAGSVNVMYE